MSNEFVFESDSFKRGYEEGISGEERSYNLLSLSLVPEKFSRQFSDSIFNEKTGHWIPARLEQVSVMSPISQVAPWWEMLLILPTSLLLIAAFIVIISRFIKLIIAVNKSIIFDWVNVTRLRQIGGGFLVLYVLNMIAQLYYHYMTIAAVQLPDYYISGGDVYKTTTLLFGLIAFLIAEVFAVGLRLKEEQDLTI